MKYVPRAESGRLLECRATCAWIWLLHCRLWLKLKQNLRGILLPAIVHSGDGGGDGDESCSGVGQMMLMVDGQTGFKVHRYSLDREPFCLCGGESETKKIYITAQDIGKLPIFAEVLWLTALRERERERERESVWVNEWVSELERELCMLNFTTVCVLRECVCVCVCVSVYVCVFVWERRGEVKTGIWYLVHSYDELKTGTTSLRK